MLSQGVLRGRLLQLSAPSRPGRASTLNLGLMISPSSGVAHSPPLVPGCHQPSYTCRKFTLGANFSLFCCHGVLVYSPACLLLHTRGDYYFSFFLFRLDTLCFPVFQGGRGPWGIFLTAAGLLPAISSLAQFFILPGGRWAVCASVSPAGTPQEK